MFWLIVPVHLGQGKWWSQVLQLRVAQGEGECLYSQALSFFLLFSFGLLAYVMTSAFEDCLTLG